VVRESGSARQGPGRELPHGPHSLTREEVLANQRARLIAATSLAVGEQGYAQTTVADVIALAGVSRKAFYQHFSNREDCFIETYDTIVAENVKLTQSACRAAGSPAQAVRAGLDALFDRVVEDPLEVRLVLVEVAALGSEGEKRRESMIATYERMLRDNLTQDAPPVPPAILRAILGGISHVLHTRVRTSREHQLHKLTADLVDWMTSYTRASEALMSAEALPEIHPGALSGGRAPGTLWPSTPTSGRRRGLRGEHIGSHSFVVHSQRERILDAVASLSTAKGYAAVTVKDISETAAVSLDAFYEHFEGKEDAFLVAYEIGHCKARAIVERAYDAARDWRSAVHAAIAALFQFLASEPAFAHLSLVDARVATSRTAERAIKGMDAYTQLLVPRLKDVPAARRPPAVVIEAIAGGLFELCVSYTLQSRAHELPQLTSQATYFALAPFLGSTQATKVATGATAPAATPRRR
jgi:AcrR family transcriptional regulator